MLSPRRNLRKLIRKSKRETANEMASLIRPAITGANRLRLWEERPSGLPEEDRWILGMDAAQGSLNIKKMVKTLDENGLRPARIRIEVFEYLMTMKDKYLQSLLRTPVNKALKQKLWVILERKMEEYYRKRILERTPVIADVTGIPYHLLESDEFGRYFAFKRRKSKRRSRKRKSRKRKSKRKSRRKRRSPRRKHRSCRRKRRSRKSR